MYPSTWYKYTHALVKRYPSSIADPGYLWMPFRVTKLLDLDVLYKCLVKYITGAMALLYLDIGSIELAG